MSDEKRRKVRHICAACGEDQQRGATKWIGDHACKALAGDTIQDAMGQGYICACDEERGRVWTAGWPAVEEDMANFRIVRRAERERRVDKLQHASESKVYGHIARDQLARLRAEGGFEE
jgi:hypothetical protein